MHTMPKLGIVHGYNQQKMWLLTIRTTDGVNDKNCGAPILIDQYDRWCNRQIAVMNLSLTIIMIYGRHDKKCGMHTANQ